MANILIVDDDKMLCQALSSVIESFGHKAEKAYTLGEGLDKSMASHFELVILDVWLPDGNGLYAMDQFKESPSQPEIIILTGSGDPDGAEMAIRSGAWDYITKPPTINKIKLPVQRAIECYKKKRTLKPTTALKWDGIIGESHAIKACLDLVAQAASTDANVLITGETGTGKELFARAIHNNSSRADQPFVVVDCAALPENLVESMLFGHEKGAFTNADRKYDGLIRQAHQGTVFLDEVGELPMSVQKAFLRVLQEHRFRPVGGTKEITCDFRLVAATNRDLEQMVYEGLFRHDLLFRLRTVSIDLPPLRKIPGDIKELLVYYVGRICHKMDINTKGYTPEFLDALTKYHWPGNVRELANAIESAVTEAGDEPVLYPRHLPMNIRVHLARSSLSDPESGKNEPQPLKPDPKNFPKLKDYRADALAELESQYLKELISISGGEIKKACDLSGLSRARLYALLKTYDIQRN